MGLELVKNQRQTLSLPGKTWARKAKGFKTLLSIARQWEKKTTTITTTAIIIIITTTTTTTTTTTITITIMIMVFFAKR